MKIDIEQILREQKVPDVLNKVMATPVEIQPEKPYKQRQFKVLAMACCLFLIMIGGFSLYKGQEENYIYLDINPSVGFVVDGWDKVTQVSLLNEDAQVMLVEENLVGLSLQEATKKVIDLAIETGYIDVDSEENALMFSLVEEGSRARNMQKLSQETRAYLQTKGILCEVLEGNFAENLRNEAQSLGISPGKLRFIKQIITIKPELTVEELKDKTMRELNRIWKTAHNPAPNGPEGLRDQRQQKIEENRQKLEEFLNQRKEDLEERYRQWQEKKEQQQNSGNNNGNDNGNGNGNK